MKLKWNGFDLDLTVEELKQMTEKGLLGPDGEKGPYPGKPAVPESAPTVVPCRPGNSEPYRGYDWFRYKPSKTPVEEEQQRFRDPLPGEFPNIMCHCDN